MSTIIYPKPGTPYGLWLQGESILRDTVIFAGEQAGVIDSEKSDKLTILGWDSVKLITQMGNSTHWLARLRNTIGRVNRLDVSGVFGKVVEHGLYLNMGGPFVGTQIFVEKVGGQAWQSCFRPDETTLLLPKGHPGGTISLVLFHYEDVGNVDSGVGGGASYAMSFFATGQRINIEHLSGEVDLDQWTNWAGDQFNSRGGLLVEAEYPYSGGRAPWFKAVKKDNGQWYAQDFTTPSLYVGDSVFRHVRPDRAIARLSGIDELLLENVDFGDEGFIEIDRPDLPNDPRCDVDCGRVRLYGCKGKAQLRYRGIILGEVGTYAGQVGNLVSEPG